MADIKVSISVNENADGLTDRDVIRSFVENRENEIRPDRLLVTKSTFVKLSDPNDICFIVAERGVGKTQVLRYLKLVLQERGDTVLSITLSGPIYKRFLSLKEENLSDPSPFTTDDLWKLAIFEEAWIALAKKYVVERNFYFGQFAHKNGYWRSLGITPRVVRYIRDRRSNDYEAIDKVWFDQDMVLNSFQKFLSLILGDRRKVTVSTAAPQPTQFTYEGAVEKLINDDSLVIDKRTALDLLEKDILTTLRYLQGIKPHHSLQYQVDHLLPSCPSVFVVADGLDQDEDLEFRGDGSKVIGGPISKDDLFALVVLTKRLNENSGEWNLGNNRNFKIITSMRAISFFGASPGKISLQNRMGDLVQAFSKFDSLSWTETAIKRMVLRRMLNGEDISSIREIDAELNRRIPPLYFWGRNFDPGIKFLMEFSGGKIRSLIRLWGECAKATSEQMDSPFTKELTQDDLVSGLQNYSRSVLSSEIGKEYAQEYPGIGRLLAFLHSKRHRIKRVIKKGELLSLIREYMNSESNLPNWMQVSNPNFTVKPLFEMGIIGLPKENTRLDREWPAVDYKSYKIEEMNKSSIEVESLRLKKATDLVINPAFWYYLTNIRVEIIERRRFLYRMYNALDRFSRDLGKDLREINTRGGVERLNISLGKFLIVGDLIKTFTESPEPFDWRTWQSVTEAIQLVEGKVEYMIYGNQAGDLSRLAGSYSACLETTPSPRNPNLVFKTNYFPKILDGAHQFSNLTPPYLEEIISELSGPKKPGVPLIALLARSTKAIEDLGAKIGESYV